MPNMALVEASFLGKTSQPASDLGWWQSAPWMGEERAKSIMKAIQRNMIAIGKLIEQP